MKRGNPEQRAARTLRLAWFDTPRTIDYLWRVTDIALTARISTRTRTVQAWPLAEWSEQKAASAEASHPSAAPPACAQVDTARLPDCGEKVGGHCVLLA